MAKYLDHSKHSLGEENLSKKHLSKKYIYEQVKLIFDQRAKAYSSPPHPVLREAAQRMHERLGYIKLIPTNLLDAGCGVGYDTKLLRQKYIHANIVGVDVSINVLKTALKILITLRRFFSFKTWFFPRKNANLNFVQSNFDALPFASDCFDLVWSNLALHWHLRSEIVISEWHRVIKQDALLMFSAFGPDTLIELRNLIMENKSELAFDNKALQQIANFIDMHDYGDMLVTSGFNNVVMDRDTITMVYEDADTYISDIKSLGIYTKLNDCDSISESHFKALKIALADQLHNNPNGLKLTFEIIYGHAFKGKTKEQKRLENSRVRIEDIGGRKQ